MQFIKTLIDIRDSAFLE